MKKKIIATLAALMVLACGTTALAAPSVTAESLAKDVKVEAATTADGTKVEVEVEAVANESIVADAVKAAEAKDAKAEVVALVEVDAKGAKNVTITLNVPNVKASAKYLVLHFDGTKWESDSVSNVKVEAGKITATFASLSPVAIVELPAEGGATLPDTGASVVLPVAALICAAGAAGCARKVKFN